MDHHLTEVQLDNFRDLSEEAKRSLLQNALQSVHQGISDIDRSNYEMLQSL